MKTELKHFKGCNYFRSLKGNLLVVSTGRVKESEGRFEGVILNADESEHNTAPYHSNDFRMDKFEIVDKNEVKVHYHEFK